MRHIYAWGMYDEGEQVLEEIEVAPIVGNMVVSCLR